MEKEKNVMVEPQKKYEFTSPVDIDDFSVLCRQTEEVRTRRNNVLHGKEEPAYPSELVELDKLLDESDKRILAIRSTKNFDKIKVISNIKELAKQKGIKFGDIETASGTTVGYTSRLNSIYNPNDPSAEFIVTAAKMLGISVDDLINKDFTDKGVPLTDNEQEVLTFIRRLISQTESKNLEWDKEAKNDLDSLEYEVRRGRVYVNHPLFTTLEVPNRDAELFDDHPEKDYIVIYDDLFYDDDDRRTARINGAGYVAELPGTEAYVYLMNVVAESVDDPFMVDGAGERELVIYDTDEKEIEPLCSTEFACDAIKTEMYKLYDILEAQSSKLAISSRSRRIMKAFLDETAEELPF